MRMKELEGENILAIELPADESYLKFVVSAPENSGFSTLNARFFNSDGHKVEVEFLTLHLNLLWDSDDDSVTLGEFESVDLADGGYLISGDFGQVVVRCNSCSPNI
ncbi:hypothetical protein TQ33_0575 [Kangiella geojedonensis]|uniref:Uncharacterized protein n=2 Tax=Kangiella geojedonensis TaxID=914150 RepID=A0A0F6RBY0_9GAMM|nr:hypothetical protein TQ33_0575 [Kangiella geojedonensis]